MRRKMHPLELLIPWLGMVLIMFSGVVDNLDKIIIKVSKLLAFLICVSIVVVVYTIITDILKIKRKTHPLEAMTVIIGFTAGIVFPDLINDIGDIIKVPLLVAVLIYTAIFGAVYFTVTCILRFLKKQSQEENIARNTPPLK